MSQSRVAFDRGAKGRLERTEQYAYVVRTFVDAEDGELTALPPTICFERELALKIAESDVPNAAGVALFEIDFVSPSTGPIRPFKVYGNIPLEFRRTERRSLLAGAAAPA
jgi:hypothetical protein